MKRLCQLASGIFSPKTQLRLAWLQLVITLIGWPLSIFLVNEPPVILSLSWWAVLATALNYISSAQANVQVSGDEGKKE